MDPKRLFVLNAVIAGGYGIALLVVTDPILEIYGITANPEGLYGPLVRAGATGHGSDDLAGKGRSGLRRGTGRSPAPWP